MSTLLKPTIHKGVNQMRKIEMNMNAAIMLGRDWEQANTMTYRKPFAQGADVCTRKGRPFLNGEAVLRWYEDGEVAL